MNVYKVNPWKLLLAAGVKVDSDLIKAANLITDEAGLDYRDYAFLHQDLVVETLQARITAERERKAAAAAKRQGEASAKAEARKAVAAARKAMAAIGLELDYSGLPR
jgi:hypothetical protein